MVTWIIFGIVALLSILSGFKKGFAKSGISLIMNIISCVIAFVISRVMVNSLAVKIGKEFVKELETKYGSSAARMPVMEEFFRFMMSVVISIFVFYAVYFIVRIITAILKHLLIYKLIDESKEENTNGYGAVDSNVKNYDISKIGIIACKLLSTALTFVILITPIGFMINVTSDFFSDFSGFKVYKVPFVSEVFLDELTEIPNNKNKVKTTDEIKYIANSSFAIVNIIKDDYNNEEYITKFQKNFSKSHFLPTVICEVGSTSAKQWKNGEDFLGVTHNIPDSREGELELKFWNILENWDKKAVVEDITTITRVISLCYDYGDKNFKGNDIEDDEQLMIALCDEEFMQELFLILYKNNDFAKLTTDVVKYGLGEALGNEVGLDKEYLEIIDIANLDEDEIRTEAIITSGVIKMAYELEKADLSQEDIQMITNELEKLKDSEALGEMATDYINQLNGISEVQL